jgi:hypothetical protein
MTELSEFLSGRGYLALPLQRSAVGHIEEDAGGALAMRAVVSRLK